MSDGLVRPAAWSHSVEEQMKILGEQIKEEPKVERGEPTSGLEPLTCSLRVSSFPTQNPLEMAVLQALLALLCPPRIRKCRQISPLLLTLLLTIADASSLGSPSPLFCRVNGEHPKLFRRRWDTHHRHHNGHVLTHTAQPAAGRRGEV
jgi:hypothetical protein